MQTGVVFLVIGLTALVETLLEHLVLLADPMSLQAAYVGLFLL